MIKYLQKKPMPLSAAPQKIFLLFILCILPVHTGFAKAITSPNPVNATNPIGIEESVSSENMPKNIAANEAKIIRVLEHIIERMENSPVFEASYLSPGLLVDKIINRTKSKKVNTQALDQALRNYIFNKTPLKMLPPLNKNYMFKTKIVIEDAPNKKKKKEMERYFIRVEIYDKSEKLKGYWSGTTATK
jgi:hypothetical protein